MSGLSTTLRGWSWRGPSIRLRLTLLYVTILMAVLVVFTAVVYLVLTRGLRAEMDHSLELAAHGVLEVSSSGRLDLDPHALTPEYGVSLHTPDGRVLEANGLDAPLPWDAEASAVSPERGNVWRSIRVGNHSLRVLAQAVQVNGRVVATLQVGRSDEPVEQVVEQLGFLLAALLPITLLLALVSGLFVAGRALTPIDRIARSAAAIGAEDLSQRLPIKDVQHADEVGRMAAAFNHMLDRLEGAFQRQRQFTADASHELRTPLMLLLTQVDVAIQLPRAAEKYHTILLSLREDIVRLQRLVEVLLILARADAGEARLEREPVDLGDLAEQVVEGMRPIADERHIRLQLDARRHTIVRGDEAYLMQLLMNLVENALKHTPAGGRVTVSVALDKDQVNARVRVRDSGTGIPAEHLPYLFERFYRVDSARSSAGAGLGLAISRWIAREHGGDIEVESSPGVGSTFTVRLPYAPIGVHAVV